MQISNIHNNTFKGYDARPIKALYMQKGRLENQDALYRELHKIGQETGFDVYMNYANHEMAKNPSEIVNKPYTLKPVHELFSDKSFSQNDGKMTAFKFDARYRMPWAQDNKIFVNDKGSTKIVYPDESNGCKNTEAVNLAKKLQIESEAAKTWFEGGNVFLGTKDDGENYVLIGEDSVADGRLRTHAGMVAFKRCLRDYLNGVEMQEKNNSDVEEIENKIENIAKQFNVKKENIFIIKQPDFHLDMAIRPLKYPYVLVNDFEESEKVVNDNNSPSYIKDELDRCVLHSNAKEYVKTEETIKELEKYGFKPIKIAGVFGNNVNFMNAIVHEKEDGSLCYITNSCECDKEGYYKLQSAFKKQLTQKCPDIKDVRFVGGGPYCVGSNMIMSILRNQSGGVHCLTAEEPRF